MSGEQTTLLSFDPREAEKSIDEAFTRSQNKSLLKFGLDVVMSYANTYVSNVCKS